MEDIEIKNKIEELCADKNFCEKMAMCNTIPELAELFASEGVETDVADLENALASARATHGSDELSECDLDNVSGGCATAFLIGAILYSIGCIAWAVYCASRARRR